VSGSTVYAGGYFSQIGGQSRSNLAALNAPTGVALPWDPAPNNTVVYLLADGETVYAGGLFTAIGGLPQSYFAAIVASTTAVPEGPRTAAGLRLEPCRPNPFRSATDIRFTLAAAADVTLTVYDLAGREVATPVRGERLGPGPHAAAFDGRDLPSGVYLCALRAGRETDTRKIVLAK
jgi:hypothetical protein